MVDFNQVNFQKNSATRHAVIEGLHVGEGVPVALAAGAPRPILFGDQMQRGCPRRVGAAKNTCFLYGEEFLFGDAVFFRVQPPRAGEHGGGATCVDVMHNAVERLGRGGDGAQQRWEFLAEKNQDNAYLFIMHCLERGEEPGKK